MPYKIDPEFQSVLPELTAQEYTELEKDIVKNGVLSPIIVWGETIVDGHNRHAICQAHRIENIPAKQMEFASKDDALEWILRNQLGRRNLNDFQRAKIALRYEEVIKAKMKERQREAGGDRKSERAKIGYGQKTRSDSIKSDITETPTTTRAELAKIAGTSESAVARTKTILNKGTPEQIARAEAGGKGNGIGAIAAEIREGRTEPEMRKCAECGRVLPVSEFHRNAHYCKECAKENAKLSYGEGVKGTKVQMPPEIRKLTKEQIIGDLYDTDKVIDFTDDDLTEELEANINNFWWGTQNSLKMHADIMENEKSRDKVLEPLSLLRSKITTLLKEEYHYE